MAPSKERKGKKMKRLFLMTIAMLSMTMTFAENEEAKNVANVEAYDMTINMRNSYMTRDDTGNWTTNSLTLTYWEKGNKTQQVTVLQKRTLTYWE